VSSVKIKKILNSFPVTMTNQKTIPENKTVPILNEIFVLVQEKTGHDFSLYKKNTIYRRIQRRMKVCQIQEMSQYFMYLKENPDEISFLCNEFLINVTQFFRDPEAYNSLKSSLSWMLHGKVDGDVIRIWVPGCSSGEEVYSIAIILKELSEEIGKSFKVQIFGTDLDESVIKTARSGRYNDIDANVSPERLEKYFFRKDNEYIIKNEIREMMIFSTHNVITDPPFTKLDMISCRNLLIYLESKAQKQVILNFINALNMGGILFLGPSENIGNFLEAFNVDDNKWNILRCISSGRRLENLKTNLYFIP